MQLRKSITIGKAYKKAYNLGLVLQGERPTLGTKFYMSYDEQGIHVRVECEIDENLHTPFDGDGVPVWRGDAVEVFLSPYGRENWYYEFDFAPNGANFHAHIYNPDGWTAYNHGLAPECGVTGEIKIENGVWTTEMFIPYSAMELQGKSLDDVKMLPWRFNVYRICDGNEEYCSFAPTYMEQINFHVSSAFADLIME